jgi:hypothetical protein
MRVRGAGVGDLPHWHRSVPSRMVGAYCSPRLSSQGTGVRRPRTSMTDQLPKPADRVHAVGGNAKATTD